MSVRRGAALALGLAVAALATLQASAQDNSAAGPPTRAKVLDIRAKVLDIERKVTSLGGAVSRTDSGKQVRVGLSADVLFRFNSASDRAGRAGPA